MYKLVVYLEILATVLAFPFTDVVPRIDENSSWRVVGGSPAPASRYPFIVSLRTRSDVHNCGGTIINTDWILTAAHCLVGTKPHLTQIVSGSNALNNGGDRYDSSRFIIHNEYRHFLFINDIALIELDTQILLHERVSLVSIENTFIEKGTPATLIGWGSIELDGITPNYLQHLNTTILSVEDCQNQHHAFPVDENQICSFREIGRGACHGDSGGPLVLTESHQSQIGIVSWGRPCAIGFPDVYVRVSAYLDWIYANIEI